MAIELHHLHPGHDDELTHLKARIAELEKENQTLAEDVSDKIESITELMELVEKYKSQKAYLEEELEASKTHTVHIAKMNAKIEELKAKNAQLEDDVAFWKKKLSSCLNGDCILTCDTVEKYGKENVRLKRALYKACAMWADRTRLICSVFGSDAPRIRWERMLGRCRAMAEKFGG